MVISKKAKWVIDLLLFNAKWAIFSYIMATIMYFLMKCWWCLFCTGRWPGVLQWYLPETTVEEQTCRSTRTHFLESEQTSSCLLVSVLTFASCSEKKQHNHFSFFLLELTIYNTQGEYANHYNAKVVAYLKEIKREKSMRWFVFDQLFYFLYRHQTEFFKKSIYKIRCCWG